MTQLFCDITEDAEEIVKELLHLPEHHRVVGLLSLGMPETGEKS